MKLVSEWVLVNDIGCGVEKVVVCPLSTGLLFISGSI